VHHPHRTDHLSCKQMVKFEWCYNILVWELHMKWRG
jgi:hypothetical protein